MRRTFLICLMVLLPFQFSWSAVAATCMHERLEGSSHWGHHEAEHSKEASAEPTTDSASLDVESRSGIANFDHHHLPGVYPFPSLFLSSFHVGNASRALPKLSADFSTATISGLERPPKLLAAIFRRDLVWDD